MQIQIRYEGNSDKEYSCCARAEVRGEKHFGIGKTWEQAKANLLTKIHNCVGQVIPPPETVEVEVAGEEMEMPELLPASMLEQVVFGGSKVKEGVTANE